MNAEPLILNVDDYAANRYVRSGLLRKAGYRVEEAGNGREALERIVELRPDLVVLDVQMPEIDGLEVCRRVRSHPTLASTLILHVSATATASESVVLGLDNGADGYLTDAADPAVLLATVRSLLRMRQAEEERNEARARLAESEGRLSRLVNNLSDVVYRLRLQPAFAFDYVSPAAVALTGYLPEEYYADPDLGWKLVHPDDLSAIEAVIRTSSAQVALAVRCVTRDGRTIWTEHRLAVIRDDRGTPVAIEAVARDITAQRTVEDELRRANHLKDEFLATLSHELRTPLNAIVGWSQMLQDGKLTSDMAERAIEAIARNAMSQRQLINDVLDVSRIITGKMRLDARVFDLTLALHGAMEAFRPAAQAKGIELRLTQSGTLALMGDADRLQQVFWNLLSNAVKFTPAGGRVEVRAQIVDRNIEVRVSDTGTGIPPWFLPHVFERFSQVDSSMSRRHHGLGLGLALVRHLVELHGGTVSVESPGEGQGTVVTVTLPVRLEGVDADRPTAGARRQEGQPAPLAGVSVLLVDDESDSRQIVGTVLRQAGARVSEAASAQTALSMLPLLLPDIIVSDIGMPEQDGLELMRLIRTLPKEAGGDVPAIALTAYGRDEDRRRAVDAGYQVHVAKPVLPEELTGHVAALAAASRGSGTRS